MKFDDSYMISTPPEKEPVMEYSLMLTTLSGETFQVSLSVAKFDRFEDLEDQVMDCLASVTDLKVFGCFIDFLQTATQTYLEDPSGTSYSEAWNTLSFFGPYVPLTLCQAMRGSRWVP